MQEKTLKTKDGIELYYYVWTPTEPAKAMVELAHGMAEHPKRYDEFATFLTQNGYLVYAPAHRGHGMTGEKMGRHGYFAEKDGWQLVLSDLKELNELMHRENPALPCLFFGHSMGSFLTRCYIQNHSDTIEGAVLCGTAPLAGAFEKFMYRLISLIKTFSGGQKVSSFLNKTTAKVQLAQIKNPRTAFDWLSRDPKEVDKYIADPHCGFDCSNQFFADLFSGWLQFSNHQENKKIRRNLPLYFIAGDADPVGNYGEGVKNSAGYYQSLGISNVRLKLYPEARHEILNEDIRQEVMLDVSAWFDRILTAKKH